MSALVVTRQGVAFDSEVMDTQPDRNPRAAAMGGEITNDLQVGRLGKIEQFPVAPLTSFSRRTTLSFSWNT